LNPTLDPTSVQYAQLDFIQIPPRSSVTSVKTGFIGEIQKLTLTTVATLKRPKIIIPNIPVDPVKMIHFALLHLNPPLLVPHPLTIKPPRPITLTKNMTLRFYNGTVMASRTSSLNFIISLLNIT
jgi:hypothetical protein